MTVEHSSFLAENEVTALDLARLIRRMSHIFDMNDLGNSNTSDALMHLSEYLSSLGSVYIKDLPLSERPPRQAGGKLGIDYGSIPLVEVKRILDQDNWSKSRLVQLARTRFGMPESRLRRLTLSEVFDTVRAAAAHEDSLDIIERNAAASGQARNS